MAVAPLAWIVLLVVAGALALRALLLWLFALAANGPVMYGEGAVAHAGAIIARGGDPYGPARAGTFVAANYSPLAYLVAAMGESIGPFFALRFASSIATLSVAVAIAWRARHQRLQAIALGASFLARFDAAGLVDHVVRRNQLPLDLGQLPSLLIACLIAIGVFIAAGLRTSDGRLRAYVAGGALVLLLGAREGATINYFLDLAVASCLGVVTVAARTQNPLL